MLVTLFPSPVNLVLGRWRYLPAIIWCVTSQLTVAVHLSCCVIPRHQKQEHGHYMPRIVLVHISISNLIKLSDFHSVAFLSSQSGINFLLLETKNLFFHIFPLLLDFPSFFEQFRIVVNVAVLDPSVAKSYSTNIIKCHKPILMTANGAWLTLLEWLELVTSVHACRFTDGCLPRCKAEVYQRFRDMCCRHRHRYDPKDSFILAAVRTSNPPQYFRHSNHCSSGIDSLFPYQVQGEGEKSYSAAPLSTDSPRPSTQIT
jgi:hypothetical protein